MITSERRAFLRRLKTEFDELFAGVDLSMGRSDDRFVVAEQAYKEWRRAIDVDALLLLDDLDAAEENIRVLLVKLSRPEPKQPAPSNATLTDADAVSLFREIGASRQAPDVIESDPDWSELFGDEPSNEVLDLGF